MASLNKVTLIGHIGKEPEIRTLQSGDKVANFSLATTENWKDKSTGENRDKTEWHKIVIFGKLAEIVERFCKKGSKIYVEGKLVTDKYTDKEGIERYVAKIYLQGFGASLIMLDGKSDADSGQQKQQKNNYQASQVNNYQAPLAYDADLNDEVPF